MEVRSRLQYWIAPACSCSRASDRSGGRRGRGSLPICKIALKTTRPLPESYPRKLLTCGDHVRKKRLDLGLFQKDVARILEVNTDTICNRDNNRTSPELANMPNIKKFLGYAPYCGSCRSLGEKIAMYRQFPGLSQKALAKHIGVDSSTVERWEKICPSPKKNYWKGCTAFFFEKKDWKIVERLFRNKKTFNIQAGLIYT